MKRALLIFFIIFVLMQFIQTSKQLPIEDKAYELKTQSNISSMLKTSCYDCHSNEVKWPWYSNIAPFSWVISNHVNEGRKALNFSIWEKYTKEEKEEHLKDIYRTVYASMPLHSYLWLHKEADLTKEQRKMIRDWTGVRK